MRGNRLAFVHIPIRANVKDVSISSVEVAGTVVIDTTGPCSCFRGVELWG